MSKIDSLVVEWSSGTKQVVYEIEANRTISVNEDNSILANSINNDSKSIFSRVNNFIKYSHRENVFYDFSNEILLPYKQSTLGPFISTADLNNDGKEDIFIGGAHKQDAKIFLSNENGLIEKNIESFEVDSKNEDMESIFIDIDNDNDLDLYVVSGGNEFNNRSIELADRIYLNDGKEILKEIHKKIYKNTISGKTVISMIMIMTEIMT